MMWRIFLDAHTTIKDVGQLDETTFMYTEEGEWAYRAGKKGWKVYFVPITGVVHFGGPNLTTDNHEPRIIIDQHKGILNIFRKHHSQIEFWLVKWLIILVSSIKLLFSPITGKSMLHKTKPYPNIHIQIIKMALNFDG